MPGLTATAWRSSRSWLSALILQSRPHRACVPLQPVARWLGPRAPAPNPSISVFALGQYLAELRDREKRLEELSFTLGLEAPQGPLDLKRLNQRRAHEAGLAIGRHIEGVEVAILTGRAISLQDAVVQLMVTVGELGMVGDRDEPIADSDMKKLGGALESVLRVIAREAGLKLSTLAGANYASAWTEHWPDVDVSRVQLDDDPADLVIGEPVESTP